MHLRDLCLIWLLVWVAQASSFFLPGTPSTPAKISRHSSLVMRERKCDIAGTRRNKANSVSKSNVHTRKFQLVNLQYRKLWWSEGNCFVRIRISTRTLKTIKKNGLHATAKKHDIDLRKFIIKMDTPKGTIPNPPLQYGEVKMKFRTAKKAKPLQQGVKRRIEPHIPVIPLAGSLSEEDLIDEMEESFEDQMDDLAE